jgi:hypothetical protein
MQLGRPSDKYLKSVSIILSQICSVCPRLSGLGPEGIGHPLVNS